MTAPTPADRALALFDAFLRHARGAAGPPSPPSPRSPLPPARAGRGARPPEVTDDEATRVVQLPTRPPPAAPARWDGDDATEESAGPERATEERTDLAVRLPEAPPAPSPAATPVMEERSIIIDDDSLTNPLLERDATIGPPPAVLPSSATPSAARPPPATTSGALDALLQEMAVLVKYGHAAQAGEELERWCQANPDDLQGQLRVAEFEMARVDREAALRRYGTLVSVFAQRGDLRSAGDVLRRLRRDMPDDHRVAAIAQWNGLG